MAKVRNVSKSLASMEDLLQGKGVVTQTRGKEEVVVHRVDVPFAVDSEAEMQALDVETYTRARVYSNETTFVDFTYDPNALAGIAPDEGAGYWVETARTSLVLRDTVTSDLYRLTMVNGVLTTTAV